MLRILIFLEVTEAEVQTEDTTAIVRKDAVALVEVVALQCPIAVRLPIPATPSTMTAINPIAIEADLFALAHKIDAQITCLSKAQKTLTK